MMVLQEKVNVCAKFHSSPFDALRYFSLDQSGHANQHADIAIPGATLLSGKQAQQPITHSKVDRPPYKRVFVCVRDYKLTAGSDLNHVSWLSELGSWYQTPRGKYEGFHLKVILSNQERGSYMGVTHVH